MLKVLPVNITLKLFLYLIVAKNDELYRCDPSLNDTIDNSIT